MTYAPKLKSKVQKLRSTGRTYSEIIKAINLNIPKSTLSKWCENVDLPEWYQEKIDRLNNVNLNKAQQYAHAQLQKKREERTAEIKAEAKRVFKNFKKDNLKIILSMLYLGEGAKSQSRLMLGNSDPNVIVLYLFLLERCYGLDRKNFGCRISYRADQDIHKLEKYWSQQTGIPLSRFYKTKPDPRTIGKKTQNEDYKGVCVITCAGAHIQLELELLSRLLLERLKGS